MRERHLNILDTPPRGLEDPFKQTSRLRHCWIYGSGPARLSNIQEVTVNRRPDHEHEWEGFMKDGKAIVQVDNVTFVHSCAEQVRLKDNNKGQIRVQTFHGIAYKPTNDAKWE